MKHRFEYCVAVLVDTWYVDMLHTSASSCTAQVLCRMPPVVWLRSKECLFLQEDRCERLCMLALPAETGVADLCAFVGGYLPRVREMRLVRREDGRSLCLVLLRFDSLASADEFYADFNNKPVNALHPAALALTGCSTPGCLYMCAMGLYKFRTLLLGRRV